jgi:hypothetical protein
MLLLHAGDHWIEISAPPIVVPRFSKPSSSTLWNNDLILRRRSRWRVAEGCRNEELTPLARSRECPVVSTVIHVALSRKIATGSSPAIVWLHLRPMGFDSLLNRGDLTDTSKRLNKRAVHRDISGPRLWCPDILMLRGKSRNDRDVRGLLSQRIRLVRNSVGCAVVNTDSMGAGPCSRVSVITTEFVVRLRHPHPHTQRHPATRLHASCSSGTGSDTSMTHGGRGGSLCTTHDARNVSPEIMNATTRHVAKPIAVPERGRRGDAQTRVGVSGGGGGVGELWLVLWWWLSRVRWALVLRRVLVEEGSGRMWWWWGVFVKKRLRFKMAPMKRLRGLALDLGGGGLKRVGIFEADAIWACPSA